MRILWITEHYPPSRGGMAESCDRIVRGLRQTGVELDIAHLTRRARPWEVRAEYGGRLLTVPLEDNPEHALRRLWTVLAGESYTHVVAFGGTYGMLAAPVLSAWLGAPLVTLLRGNDFDTGVFSLRRRAALLDALRASARVCVVASSHAPLVSALVPEVPVTWVANGIETANWEILPSERSAGHERRARAGRRTIGLVGQLKNKKGVAFLLEALRDYGFHLLLVGELEEGVEVAMEHTRLPFLDRYELPAVYAACDLVALPSFYDGLPNVALEAAALGVPLLASDAGGLGDLVDAEIGFRFRAGDPHDCRAAVDRAWRATDEELAKLGLAAAERVRRDFTVGAETEGYLRVFRDVA
ncbi:glycosyltransferase family 4 protein [Nonomuraea sp. NPDC050536]|uniref:glycosyltransferase family 4 protein n=1 Tax=Nonomuraea sp. NPDC050536 TaxID=3364366 RepID=UPI0037CAAD47